MRSGSIGPRMTSSTLKRIVESGSPVVHVFGFRGATAYPIAVARTIASACLTISILDTGPARVHGYASVNKITAMNATIQEGLNIEHLPRSIVARSTLALNVEIRR